MGHIVDDLVALCQQKVIHSRTFTRAKIYFDELHIVYHHNRGVLCVYDWLKSACINVVIYLLSLSLSPLSLSLLPSSSLFTLFLSHFCHQTRKTKKRPKSLVTNQVRFLMATVIMWQFHCVYILCICTCIHIYLPICPSI